MRWHDDNSNFVNFSNKAIYECQEINTVHSYVKVLCQYSLLEWLGDLGMSLWCPL